MVGRGRVTWAPPAAGPRRTGVFPEEPVALNLLDRSAGSSGGLRHYVGDHLAAN
jgi:hypothetical protein